jgi:hypothetical protein
VKAIVHNLSLQRFSDTEIAEHLEEKGIVLKRNTINGIKKQIEKQAERWYIDLKQSRYKYIATYKERLDSLLSYQRQLQDIITNTNKDEIKVRAIGELVSIEKVIFDIWKQLPEIEIVDNAKQEKQQEEEQDQTPQPAEPGGWV